MRPGARPRARRRDPWRWRRGWPASRCAQRLRPRRAAPSLGLGRRRAPSACAAARAAPAEWRASPRSVRGAVRRCARASFMRLVTSGCRAMSSRWISSSRPTTPRIVGDLAAFPADDALGVDAGIGDQPAAQLAAVGRADDHRVAALEAALDARDAGRQQALAGRQRLLGAGVDVDVALRLELPGDPALARRHRIGVGEEPGARRALADRAQRVEHLAAGDHHVRAGAERDLRRLDLGAHAALRQLGAGVAGHGLDLRRDGGDDVEARRIGVGVGRRRVEPVDVGQQHEAIGRHHGGDARRQAVVVAVADLGRRHRVVLVDDRHGLEVEQRLDGVARVEIAAALLGVAERQQDLRGDEAARARTCPGRRAPG